jgi:hypothetical protein
LAEGLRRHGLSREAAEEPSILHRHIERVAEQVHRILRRPAEHAPVEIEDDDDFGAAADPEAAEKLWDELAKQNRRQQERLQRALEERLSRGLDHETAFQEALREIVPGLPDEETDRSDEPWRGDEPLPFGESFAGKEEKDGDRFEAEEEERHPLLQSAMDLLVRLDLLFGDTEPRFGPTLSTLYQGAGDAMGGLAQALGDPDQAPDDYGLCVVQLKRVLRGAAFARGALFPLRSILNKEQFDELFHTLRQIETDIVSELGKLRSEPGNDDR